MLHRALRLMRVFHDLTQKELAELLGISKSHISEIEAGKKTPTLAVLARYASVFEVPVSSILFLSENLDRDIDQELTRVFVHPKILTMINFVFLKNKNRS